MAAAAAVNPYPDTSRCSDKMRIPPRWWSLPAQAFKKKFKEEEEEDKDEKKIIPPSLLLLLTTYRYRYRYYITAVLIPQLLTYRLYAHGISHNVYNSIYRLRSIAANVQRQK